jgi:opacity protein-like surface antigen
MKKLAIMTILALAAVTASANDIGLRVGRLGGATTNDAGLTGAGVTLGRQFGAFGAELSYDRALIGSSSVSRYALVGSYPLLNYSGMTLAAKAGTAFIDPTAGLNGYAVTLGVGASYPLTKNVNLVADYSYQAGQDRVKSFNGNLVTVGTKYTF